MKINIETIINQYKFCFVCGGKLNKNGNNLLVCETCGFNNYVNPTPCTGAILINDKEEILLVERKIDPGKGLWDMPGGFIDLNETAEESIIRELKEELSINTKPEDLKYISSHIDTYEYNDFTFNTLGFVYTGKIDNQEIKVNDDVAGYKFFKLDEIPSDKLAFESLREVLKKIKNQQ